MRQIFILLILLGTYVQTVSCRENRDNESRETLVVEKTARVESLSESVAASLDSLAGLLIDEYKGYDLPHYNPGVGKTLKRVEAIFCPTNEETIEYSFGLLFCSFGVDSTAAGVKQSSLDRISLNQSRFPLPLPCSFEDYIRLDVPTCKLFGDYYRKCVETGNVEYFWKFQYAFHSEAEFLLSLNPEDILSAASEEQYQSFVRKCRICRSAIEVLSKENPGYSSLLEYRQAQADRFGLENNKSFPDIRSAVAGYPKYSMYFRCITHNLLTR